LESRIGRKTETEDVMFDSSLMGDYN
jgi:hypothetical protein